MCGVGSLEFVQKLKQELGARAKGRKMVGGPGDFVLREPTASYNSFFGAKKEDIGSDNAIYWDNYQEILDG